jgi:hypothetical protein
LTVLGLVLCGGAQARAGTLLRWKFSTGDSSKYTMTMTMRQEVTVNGMVIKTLMDQVVDYTWAIGSVNSDGTAAMSQTIDRVRMEVKSAQGAQGQTLKYDSADKEAPTGLGAQLAPMMEALVGKAMTMRVTPRGEISDFKVPEEMLAGFKKGPGMEQLGGIFSEQGLKQMASQGMLKFPEEEVATGDSWNTSVEIPNPILGTQKVVSAYTYAGTENVDGQQLDKIELKLDMKFEVPKDSPNQVDLKDQKTNGKIHFDNAMGRLIDAENLSTIKMEITAGGMTIGSDVNTKATIKLNQGKKST